MQAQVAHHANAIYLHGGVTYAMPHGDVRFIAEKKREEIVAWLRAAEI